jgi:hypothetical protein
MEQSSLNNMSKLSLNKDVFKQKGGTLGLVILAGLFCLVAFNLPAILAWVNTLLKLIVSLVGLAAFLYVAFDPKVRLAVSTFYMIAIRKLLGWIVKMDPISILEDTIKKMFKSISRLEDSMGKLNGVRLKLKDKIEEKKEDLRDCLERKKVAIRQGKNDLQIVEDRQSVRLQKLVEDYMELHDSSEKWYNVMSKIADMAKLTVQDAENEVEAQKERYSMVKLSHSAFKSAMSVINGNPDELALYNQAWAYTQEDIMAKLGEMDRVINTAGGLMDKIDVEKEVYKIKGDDLLKKYDELGLDALFDKFEPSKIAFPIEGMMTGEKTLKETKAKYF